MAKTTGKLLFIGFGLLWAGLTSAGLCMLWGYSYEPGNIGSVPSSWPEGISAGVRDKEKPTLLVFLHPECGCSRASLAELERVALHASRPFAIRIYFNDSEGLESPANESALWAAALRVPGAVLSADGAGRITRAFGAETSGTCLLFDSEGRLIFKGGLTGSRGHEGDNPNQDALLATLAGGARGLVQSTVYGCEIF